MRIVLAALSLAALTACGPSIAAPGSLADVKEITVPAEDTQLLAVLSYASWCGACKALDPKVEAVRASQAYPGVEFFALDYSARNREAYFDDAKTLGIAETMHMVFPDRVKTGQLYLIDRSSGTVVGTVSQSMTEVEISAAIEAALS
ncbi:thioredoxin family protein [Hyphomonas atlantica corrig.]|uniref:thioredoxin family protein n=1 Tax=Hyphomonas atlantica TaxID=1280948 RepID=UPI002357460A|nr:thioredoxin family protein [Hyphomonas atlantica]